MRPSRRGPRVARSGDGLRGSGGGGRRAVPSRQRGRDPRSLGRDPGDGSSRFLAAHRARFDPSNPERGVRRSGRRACRRGASRSCRTHLSRAGDRHPRSQAHPQLPSGARIPGSRPRLLRGGGASRCGTISPRRSGSHIGASGASCTASNGCWQVVLSRSSSRFWSGHAVDGAEQPARSCGVRKRQATEERELDPTRQRASVWSFVGVGCGEIKLQERDLGGRELGIV